MGLLLSPACKTNSHSNAGRVCTLSADKKTFTCDVEFAPDKGKCVPTAAARREFVSRMTSVSLEMLYLEREAGGQPPFRYNDLPKVAAEIEIVSCRGSCECRMRFSDAALEEIFYDSAGCRTRSRYAAHPLYFAGRGCTGL